MQALRVSLDVKMSWAVRVIGDVRVGWAVMVSQADDWMSRGVGVSD